MNFIKKIINKLHTPAQPKETNNSQGNPPAAVTVQENPPQPKEIIDGQGNKINIDKSINYSVVIKGDNNSIEITAADSNERRQIDINITGNNNKIIIKTFRTAQLLVDIGNFSGVDNVEVEIQDNLTSAQVNIFAYQSNTPIRIGANCLFSREVNIRSGEVPHAIYDATTCEDLDKSEGIFIGDHVWIGEHAFILKKATIPSNCIVGAMSVVTKRFNEENVVIAGNPARICKRNIMWNGDVKKTPFKKNNE